MDWNPPGSYVYGDSPGKNTRVGCHALLQGIFPTQGRSSALTGRFLTNRATREAHEYWGGELTLLQEILPTQGNWGLPHCRWMPYQLSYQGSPIPRIPSFSFTINQLEKDHTSCRLPPNFTYKNSSKKTIREFGSFELEPCPCWATAINLSLHQTLIFQFLCPHCVSSTWTGFDHTTFSSKAPLLFPKKKIIYSKRAPFLLPFPY